MSVAQKIAGIVSREEGSQSDQTQVLSQFIAEEPNCVYAFDSKRDASQSELCREGKDKDRDCIMLQMHSTRLFRAMQDQGFFCALPMDPTQTHIECKPLPK